MKKIFRPLMSLVILLMICACGKTEPKELKSELVLNNDKIAVNATETDATELISINKDSADGDVSFSIVNDGGLNTSEVGDYKITAELSNGKLTKLFDFTISVYDDIAPQIDIKDDAKLEYKVGDSFDISDLIDITDNDNNEPEITMDDSAVDMETPGTYDINITATDASGNRSEETISIIVKDDYVRFGIGQTISSDLFDLALDGKHYVEKGRLRISSDSYMTEHDGTDFYVATGTITNNDSQSIYIRNLMNLAIITDDERIYDGYIEVYGNPSGEVLSGQTANLLFYAEIPDNIIEDSDSYELEISWYTSQDAKTFRIKLNDDNHYDIEEGSTTSDNISSFDDFELLGEWYCIRGTTLEETTEFKSDGNVIHEDKSECTWVLKPEEKCIYMYYPQMGWGGDYMIKKHNDYYIIELSDITFVRPENYDDYIKSN